MTTALVIDDEPAICQCFESLLNEIHCDVHVAASAEEGLVLAEALSFDVIVLDVRLPGMDGLAALARFRELTSAPIIIMTAHGNLSTAVSAVHDGAFDYLPKPFDLGHVTQVLQRAITESAERASTAPKSKATTATPGEMAGSSLAMQHLFRQIAMAAQHDAPVLITGESGTGKELVAQAIHHHSLRKKKPLVAVHLASLSEGLLERELFGHAAGAFTGAERSQAGMIAQADGSTLFLDEIGDAPRSFQTRLLRAIESGEFYPVGSAAAQRSDFRLISATNVPLEVLRSAEHFRQDFFFRLATIQIRVPPLREHLDDVPELAAHFLRQHSPGSSRQLTAEAIQLLQQQRYPGNIRELRNLVIRSAAESPERSIDVATIRATLASAVVTEQSSSPGSTPPDQKLTDAAQEWARDALRHHQSAPLQAASDIVERELILAAMQQTGGNRSAAAQLLGIHRETLREKLSKHDLSDAG
ncbi:MAG: sigma-54 dependent transcriptional regulator [Planctomycetaceae bacterium]